ncbi:hypothetical protein FQR65_LT17916 [Abscondita terminalis]|nr:hypothetical protein FQR65_LT17916 [Abscondita terminalis]
MLASNSFQYFQFCLRSVRAQDIRAGKWKTSNGAGKEFRRKEPGPENNATRSGELEMGIELLWKKIRLSAATGSFDTKTSSWLRTPDPIPNWEDHIRRLSVYGSVAARRTAIGSFGGALSTLSATELGAKAVSAVLDQSGIAPEYIDELLMGCVLQANLGQAPARQVAKISGLPDHAVLLLVSEEKVKEWGLSPLAEIVAYADAEQAPEWFTTTPSIATEKVLKKAGLSLSDIDYFEFNERFFCSGISKREAL